MAKICNVCGYAPTKEQEQEPTEPAEDCPQCGGKGTVVDEEAALNEDINEEE